MNVGDKVKVSFEVEVLSVNNNHGERSFFCGDVDLGPHETNDKCLEPRMKAFVSGIPMKAVVHE